MGSIGYVEYAYAKQSNLVYTDMINAAGQRVKPTMEAFQAAAANADFSKVQDFYEILTNQPGAQSWPITAATYMLMRADYPADKNKAVLKFLDWALQGRRRAMPRQLDYVPMPDSVVKQIEASWARRCMWRLRRSNKRAEPAAGNSAGSPLPAGMRFHPA